MNHILYGCRDYLYAIWLRMIQAEELLAVKVGKEWRVSAEALQDFMADPI